VKQPKTFVLLLFSLINITNNYAKNYGIFPIFLQFFVIFGASGISSFLSAAQYF